MGFLCVLFLGHVKGYDSVADSDIYKHLGASLYVWISERRCATLSSVGGVGTR